MGSKCPTVFVDPPPDISNVSVQKCHLNLKVDIPTNYSCIFAHACLGGSIMLRAYLFLYLYGYMIILNGSLKEY